jgi:hypothetical protein
MRHPYRTGDQLEVQGLERRQARFVSRCCPYLNRCKYAANTVTAYRRQCDASPGWTSTPMSTPMLSQPGEAQAINIEHRDHHLLKGLDTPTRAADCIGVIIQPRPSDQKTRRRGGWCPDGDGDLRRPRGCGCTGPTRLKDYMRHLAALTHPGRSVQRWLPSWPNRCRSAIEASLPASPANPPAARTAIDRSARSCD